MKVNRLIILVIGLVTLWMAFNMVGIVKMMMIGLSLTTAFTLVFLATMFVPGLCRKTRRSGRPLSVLRASWSGPWFLLSGFPSRHLLRMGHLPVYLRPRAALRQDADPPARSQGGLRENDGKGSAGKPAAV